MTDPAQGTRAAASLTYLTGTNIFHLKNPHNQQVLFHDFSNQ